MKRYIHSDINENVEINLIPLIDMLFFLLLFFIVTTSFIDEMGIEVQRPEAATSEYLNKKSIILGVTKNEKIFYGQREIAINSIRGLISRLVKYDEKPVIIVADKDSRSGILINIIDECRAGGAKQVNIATENQDLSNTSD